MKNNIRAQAVDAIVAIKAGKLAVIPTDTVYGIAALPDSKSAITALLVTKGRDARKPIALLVSDIDVVKRFGVDMNQYEQALAEQFWPGGLTIVMRTQTGIMEGFRIPDLGLTRYILKECGGVLCVSSANISGEPPALTVESAKELFNNNAISVFVDAGPVKEGVASTVVNITADGDITIFREGAILVDEIEQVLTSRFRVKCGM